MPQVSDRPYIDTSDEKSFDATQSLADALVAASGSLSEDGVKALVYLRLYSPKVSREVQPLVVSLKIRQTPGVVKKLQESIQAVALNKLWDRMSISPGSK